MDFVRIGLGPDGETPPDVIFYELEPDDPEVFRTPTITVSPAAGAIGPSTFGMDILYQFNLVDVPTTPSPFGFKADQAYRAIFDAPDTNGNQNFLLYKATGSAADGHSVDPANLVLSGNTNQNVSMPGGGMFFAGLRSDPFFFDLGGFQGSVEGASNGRAFNDGLETDFFADLNVLALVLEIPDTQLPDPGGDGFATWASTAVQNNGGWDQVDRIGRPAINTVVNSSGPIVNAPPTNKNAFNAGHPGSDNVFEQAVKDALAALSALDSEGPYTSSGLSSLTSLLLPDKLFFDDNFPPDAPFNGRRLEDDVIDIELNLLTGGFPFTGRDSQGGVSTDGIGPHNDYLSVFPYLGEPHTAPTFCNGMPTTIASTHDGQTIEGTNGADVIGVNHDNVTVNAKRGNDKACVDGNGAKVNLGPGNDQLFSGVVNGGTYRGSRGNDRFFPGAGCVNADSALIDQILADLESFYVNVHSDVFPAGAVRGQLGGGPLPPFYFGNPEDDPFLGDWDGDGIDTPGLYRPSDGKVYLRNSNTPGIADIEFFFGDPDDVPLIGDWDGDGDDTVSLYRPSEGKVLIQNKLGSNNQQLGAAEIEFLFGDPGDDPFGGDFDSDGKDTVGVKRGSVFYWRNSLSTGPADNGNGLTFGDLDDDPMFGDWDGDGLETPGVYRPSNGTIFLRNLQEPGIADMEIFTDGFESGDVSAWSTGQ